MGCGKGLRPHTVSWFANTTSVVSTQHCSMFSRSQPDGRGVLRWLRNLFKGDILHKKTHNCGPPVQYSSKHHGWHAVFRGSPGTDTPRPVASPLTLLAVCQCALATLSQPSAVAPASGQGPYCWPFTAKGCRHVVCDSRDAEMSVNGQRCLNPNFSREATSPLSVKQVTLHRSHLMQNRYRKPTRTSRNLCLEQRWAWCRPAA